MMSSRLRQCPFALGFLLTAALAGSASGEVTMPAIFGDHMVLQRDAKVPVWGWAGAGEKISVTLGGQTCSAVTSADGKWRVDLPAGPKNAQAQVLTVTGTNTLSFQDVLVGDVWLASGQSNMEFGIQTDSVGPEAIKEADDLQLRMFCVPGATALDPKTDLQKLPPGSLNGKWQVCTPAVMGAPNWAWHGFSAVGYYFARDVRRSTGVPIGMIGSYKGSTSAQAWTSLDGLGKDPELAHYLTEHRTLVDHYEQASQSFPKLRAEYETAMKEWNQNNKEYQAAVAKWEEATAQATAAGQPAPPKPNPTTKMPAPPASPDGGTRDPVTYYNGMIAPLIPYALKGVIWYQGESNGDKLPDAVEYTTLFPRLIKDWRAKWGQDGLPFLYVQLANFKALSKTPSEGIWPWVREAQLKTLALPATGMASAIDIGNPVDIHPKDKLDVGRRLALAARHVAYGEQIVYSGPIFDESKVAGDEIRLTFKQSGGGLMMGVPPWTPAGRPPAPPVKLAGFGIAGVDQNFVWADAVIEGNNVVVKNPQVAHPVAVRYDWGDSPEGNLYNKEGLPASPFRTDDWAAALPAKSPGSAAPR